MKDYDPKNLIYGLVMVASFLFIFSLIKDNLKLDKKGFEQIALGFVTIIAAIAAAAVTHKFKI